MQSPYSNIWHEASAGAMLSMLLSSPGFVLSGMLVSFRTASVLTLGQEKKIDDTSSFFFFLN